MIKKVRKLRAMTYEEFCDRFEENCPQCPFLNQSCGLKGDKPCKPYGKYILVEVKK